MRKRFYIKPDLKLFLDQDPLRFSRSQITDLIENHFNIYSSRFGKNIPFKLNNNQKQIIKSVSENKITVISKTRQLGVSTVMQSILTLLMADADVTVYYICHNKQSAKSRKQSMIYLLECLKEFELQYKSPDNPSSFDIIKETENSYTLSNFSKIKFTTYDPNLFRGSNAMHVYFDECLPNNVADAMIMLGPITNAIKGHRIIISNPTSEAEYISQSLRNLRHHFLNIPRGEYHLSPATY